MPRANQDLPPVSPTETINVTADNFPLAAGETLSTAAWSIALVSGIDSLPTSRLIGGPSIPSPGIATIQQVGTCQGGAVYDLIVTVTTTAAQTLTTNAHLACQAIS